MNTILTRRPLLRRLWGSVQRIWAHAQAWRIRQVIKSTETEWTAHREALDNLPQQMDEIWGRLEVLRVQLALAEKRT